MQRCRDQGLLKPASQLPGAVPEGVRMTSAQQCYCLKESDCPVSSLPDSLDLSWMRRQAGVCTAGAAKHWRLSVDIHLWPAGRVLQERCSTADWQGALHALYMLSTVLVIRAVRCVVGASCASSRGGCLRCSWVRQAQPQDALLDPLHALLQLQSAGPPAAQGGLCAIPAPAVKGHAKSPTGVCQLASLSAALRLVSSDPAHTGLEGSKSSQQPELSAL